MKTWFLATAASLAACSPAPPAATPGTPADVTIPSAAPAPSAAASAAPAPAWTPRPRTLAMRTIIEGPLVVHRDGTSSLSAARNVVRVSDHYSACFVTRSAEVACWGVANGGTWNGVAKRDPDAGLHEVVDVSINQTNACVATRDGSVLCWRGDGRPRKQISRRPRARSRSPCKGARARSWTTAPSRSAPASAPAAGSACSRARCR